MSEKSIPSTPADVLQISSASLRLVIRFVTRIAEIFGFWRYPLKSAATASEEMSTVDQLYWIYKTRNPIMKRERPAGHNLSLMSTEQFGLPVNMKPEKTIEVGACGDILRSSGIENSKDVLYEKVSELLFDRDISFANFESPITTQELIEEVIGDSGPPVECCSREQFEVLTRHKGKKFNVLNLANNHILDMGLEGIETTLNVLSEEKILNVGLNRSIDEYGSAKVIEVNGLKIGFVSDNFGLNGRTLPKKERHRIHVSNLLSKYKAPDTALLRRQIDDCNAKKCDFIFASIHWGYEFEFFPRNKQIEVARSLVEYGADSIISHHPHVIQPVEVIRTNRDKDRLAVIAYSLGSITWGFSAPHIILSLILNFKLTLGSIEGRRVTLIENFQITPVFRENFRQGDVELTRIEKLIDHTDAETVFARKAGVSEMDAIVSSVLCKEWKKYSN